jgi:hypothetical protein
VPEHAKKLSCYFLFLLILAYTAFIIIQLSKHGLFHHFDEATTFLMRWSIYALPALFLAGLGFFVSLEKKTILSIVLLVLGCLVQLFLVFVVASFLKLKIAMEDTLPKLEKKLETEQTP